MINVRNKIFNSISAIIIAVLSLAFVPKNSLASYDPIFVTVPYVPAFVTSAYVVTVNPLTGTPANPFVCHAPSMVGDVAQAFKKTVKDALDNAASDIESHAQQKQKDLLEQLVADLEGIEVSVSKAWNQSWYDLMKPTLKEMAKQINVVMMEEARQLQSFFDATIAAEIQGDDDVLAVASEKEYRPSLHANVAAAGAKGFGRVTLFSRAFKKAIASEVIEAAYNKKDVDEKSSRRKYDHDRFVKYMANFCDPEAAGGTYASYCTSTDDKIYNADIQPNKFLYNRLTLPIDPNRDPNKGMYKALLALRTNLFGSPVGEIISKDILDKYDGKEKFIEKRSFMARYGAIMSVHNLIESWRVPGSQMGDWMQSLLELEAGDIKDWYRNIDNPSYKELMHALTVDKFNSGHYARNLLSNESDIKMEKLVLTAMQSVLLRDYYELLERTALVLAVQVSMMADGLDVSGDIHQLSTDDSVN